MQSLGLLHLYRGGVILEHPPPCPFIFIDASARMVGVLGYKNLSLVFINCDGHEKSPDCYAGALRESLCGLGMDSTCKIVRHWYSLQHVLVVAIEVIRLDLPFISWVAW